MVSLRVRIAYKNASGSGPQTGFETQALRVFFY